MVIDFIIIIIFLLTTHRLNCYLGTYLMMFLIIQILRCIGFLLQKLSIYGDLEFVNEQKLNRYPAASLVVVRSQAEDHEEVGPLPTKVNLAHSEI